MKKLLKLMGFIMCLSLAYSLQARTIESLLVKGDTLVQFGVGKTFVEDGVSYVPIREMSNLLGARVNWEAASEKIYMSHPTKEIVINSTLKTYYEPNNPSQTYPISIRLKQQLSYMPLRVMAELFGYSLSYIEQGPMIRILTPDMQLSDQQIYEKYQSLIKKQQDQQVLYLTFDDGPNQYTDQLLDLLAQYEAKATFFMLEGNMKKYPQTVQRMVKEGHTVALHGVTHDKAKFYNGQSGPYQEMEKANQTLKQLTGERTNVIRMPYGSVPYLSQKQLQVLERAGYAVWDWHVDSKDWSNRNGQVTFKSVVEQMNQVKQPQPVLLFHDSKYTVETIADFLEWMDQRGWTSKGLPAEQKGQNFISRTIY